MLKSRQLSKHLPAAFLVSMVILILIFPSTGEAAVVNRLKSDDPEKIQTIKRQIMQDKGYSIVFVGDSLLYSSASRKDSETIPSNFQTFMQKALPGKNVHVYDLSLPGCSFMTCNEIVKCIARAKPDMIVMDVNIGWFATVKLDHPALKNLNAIVPDKTLKPVKVQPFPDDLYKPYYSKDFSFLEKATTRLGGYATGTDNIQWMAFCNTLDIMEMTGVKGVLFFPPRNKYLYDKYNLVDGAVLEEKTSEISAIATLKKIALFDYTWRINSIYFSDILHLLPNGNKWLAKFLADDITKQFFPVPAVSKESASNPAAPGKTASDGCQQTVQ